MGATLRATKAKINAKTKKSKKAGKVKKPRHHRSLFRAIVKYLSKVRAPKSLVSEYHSMISQLSSQFKAGVFKYMLKAFRRAMASGRSVLVVGATSVKFDYKAFGLTNEPVLLTRITAGVKYFNSALATLKSGPKKATVRPSPSLIPKSHKYPMVTKAAARKFRSGMSGR